jgi:hypothetical protein
MQELNKYFLNNNRRHFLKNLGFGIGGLALGSLMDPVGMNSNSGPDPQLQAGPLPLPHFAPKAKRVIYLFQSGGPSQLDLFDYKPYLNKYRGMDLPDSIRKGQRLTGMTAGQDKFPVTGSLFNFKQYGESRAWVSDAMPHLSKVVDELCFVKSVHTEAINHDPAITFFSNRVTITGSSQYRLLDELWFGQPK